MELRKLHQDCKEPCGRAQRASVRNSESASVRLTDISEISETCSDGSLTCGIRPKNRLEHMWHQAEKQTRVRDVATTRKAQMFGLLHFRPVRFFLAQVSVETKRPPWSSENCIKTAKSRVEEREEPVLETPSRPQSDTQISEISEICSDGSLACSIRPKNRLEHMQHWWHRYCWAAAASWTAEPAGPAASPRPCSACWPCSAACWPCSCWA